MTLDPETSERLSLDAALGQLSPDVQALWDAYLRDRPELAKPAWLDRQTVAIARQALADTAPAETLKPLPAPAQWPRRVRPVAAWAASLAAGLIVGVTLGLYLAPEPPVKSAGMVVRDPRQAPANADPGAIMPAALPRPAAAAKREPDNGFWSIERLYRQARQAGTSAPATRNVIWTSPLKPPVMGDAL